VNSRVSIVIPCFNHGRFLREAIASVEQCDRDSYELIIVNDGSTDAETGKVIGDLQAAGYHVINQDNQGLAAARNAGIRVAKGAYILPLDADNRIKPDYIYKATHILDSNPEVAVAYGKPEYFGDPVELPLKPVTEFDVIQLLDGNFIDACAVFRKSAWEKCGGYDMSMPAPGLEDWDLWLSMSARGYRFYFINEVLFDYRVRHESMIHGLLQNGKFSSVVDYLTRKHPMFALYQQTVDQKRRLQRQERELNEIGMFVERIQSNTLFKAYHWLKYFGRKQNGA
jgi:glycosyltransferase involved in cell wall biosynthesis